MGEERALSSTDKRQITRLSSCHLRNRKKPFRVSLDSGRRTPDVLWISFFLSQKSRKLGRVKSSFHGPRGHTEGEERMNTPVPGLENTFGPPLIRLRLAHVILLPISRKIRFSTFRFFPSPFSPSFRNPSNDRQFSPFFFKREAVKTRNQGSSLTATDVIWWNLVDYIRYVRSENRISCGSST